MGRSGNDFTNKKSASRVGTPLADSSPINFNEYPTGVKSPRESNVGGFVKSQFTYNEDTHTFETIMEKEIKQLQKRYTYEYMFREDMKKFKEKTFDWRIEIRSNADDILNRMDILTPYTFIGEKNYPIEFIRIDDNLKRVVSPHMIYNYLNHPFRDMLSNSFIKIQKFYDLLLKYFYICHLVNDSMNLEKIDSEKICALDPWAREKIRNYARQM
jgi:hypothetical protein